MTLSNPTIDDKDEDLLDDRAWCRPRCRAKMCQGSGRFSSQRTMFFFLVRIIGREQTQTGGNFDEMIP